MPRANRVSTKNLSTTHPVLTGDSRSDWALWQLSCVMAEIADQNFRIKNDGGANVESQIQQRKDTEQVLSPSKDANDV